MQRAADRLGRRTSLCGDPLQKSGPRSSCPCHLSSLDDRGYGSRVELQTGTLLSHGLSERLTLKTSYENEYLSTERDQVARREIERSREIKVI